MPSGVIIKIKGLQEAQRKLGRFATAAINAVDNEMAAASNDFANLAIEAAPADQGMLRHGISSKRNGQLNYETVSEAFYSAYIEWGTKSKVDIPPDLTDYAAQFRGEGKPQHKFFEMILAWVERKGIGALKTGSGKISKSKASKAAQYKAARAIYYSILKHGIKAQPFFFKHRETIHKQLLQHIPNAIKNVMTK